MIVYNPNMILLMQLVYTLVLCVTMINMGFMCHVKWPVPTVSHSTIHETMKMTKVVSYMPAIPAAITVADIPLCSLLVIQYDVITRRCMNFYILL